MLRRIKQQRTAQAGKASENKSQVQNHSAEESDGELLSTNLSLTVTLSTRHVLKPSGLNTIKPQKNPRKVEGIVR